MKDYDPYHWINMWDTNNLIRETGRINNFKESRQFTELLKVQRKKQVCDLRAFII